MHAAMEEARAAAARDEVPIGAVVVHNDKIIARAGNETRALNDPTAHAEVLAIRRACAVMGAQRIPECALYVTLEPCTMCAGAISFSRVHTLVFGADDAKGGGVKHGAQFYTQPTCHHCPDVVGGVLADESAAVLKAYFRGKRNTKAK